MKIPFKHSGSLTFHMMVNAEERDMTIDLATGMVESVCNQIEIYPNPVTDKLKIRGLTDPVVARIFNIHGQLLFTANTEGHTREIDLSDLSAGYYIIMLETNKETVVKRFLRE